MKRRDLTRFFRELSRRWTRPTTVRLIGGGGAFLLGGTRPTLDVDFEVHFRTPAASWEAFSAAVAEVSSLTGIGAQYSESIERWSQLTHLDYRKHTRLVRRFGAIEVRVLDPLYWSIGKMGRYYDQDVQDMIAVFQRQKPDPVALARLWHQSLRQSPKSTQLALARRQALHFFQTHGRHIWGPSFRMDAITKIFAPGIAR